MALLDVAGIDKYLIHEHRFLNIVTAAINPQIYAEEIAFSWARKLNFTMVRQGLEDAYQLGLQTQAPVNIVFWCSGPS